MKLLKKLLCGVLSAAMLVTSAAIPVMAEENITVTLDGKILSFDVPPQTINDRTMVPLRAIFEALGATVDWNDATETVTSTKGDISIQLTVNSNTMYVNGNAVALDTPACVVNDRTLVPVRAISEAYNTKVDWDEDTQTVIISSNTQSQSKLPLINHEYGPMKLNNSFSSTGYWYSNNISSLVFTKLETTNIGKYKLFVNMQGITDHDSADVKVYFYDANNRVLGDVWFFHDVKPNTEYNVSDYKFVEENVIDNAVKIEFCSYTGETAQ